MPAPLDNDAWVARMKRVEQRSRAVQALRGPAPASLWRLAPLIAGMAGAFLATQFHWSAAALEIGFTVLAIFCVGLVIEVVMLRRRVDALAQLACASDPAEHDGPG